MSISKKLSKQLSDIYLSPELPGSFGGIEPLYRAARAKGIQGATRTAVENWLSGVAAYSLHKPVRKRFARERTYTQGIDDQWQADLVDMGADLARANHGFRYLLTCIDVFSKHAWAIPVHDKSAKSMVAALRTLFDKAAPRHPRRLQTDKGKEFVNEPVQELLKHGCPGGPIHHFASWSDQKAAVVERFNRTLKSRMWRYFTEKQTKHFLDVLPKLLHAYNNSVHRAIGMTPASVRLSDEQRIARRLYPTPRRGARSAPRGEAAAAAAAHRPAHRPAPPPNALLSEKMVRISRLKGDFEKGYMPNWSEEDFHLAEARSSPSDSPKRQRRLLYKLTDRAGETLHGQWYPEELQQIRVNRHLIERILRRRPISDSSAAGRAANIARPNGNSGTEPQECLVKWKGWPAKFNSWVPESDIITSSAATRSEPPQ